MTHIYATLRYVSSMRGLRLTICNVTLRLVKPGWSAKGLLEPLWKNLYPPTADTLAAISGVPVKTLYSYNSGKRNLGAENAEKIANALDISLYDLGSPRPRESDFALALLGQIVLEIERNPPTDFDLLRELANDVRELAANLEAVANHLAEQPPPA